MQSFFLMIGKIVFALFSLGLVLVVWDRLATETPAADSARLQSRSEGLWTQVPVSVDVARQGFERLKAAPQPAQRSVFPLTLLPARGLRVLDNARFLSDGVTYRIADVAIIDRSRICLDPQGKRYACGLKALKALDNAIRGKRLNCRVARALETMTVVDCMVGRQDLGACCASPWRRPACRRPRSSGAMSERRPRPRKSIRGAVLK